MLAVLQEVFNEAKALRKDVKQLTTERVNRSALRERAEALGTKWFAELRDTLLSDNTVPPELVEAYSDHFARLIKISAPNNLAKSYLESLDGVAKKFRNELIIPIQQKPKTGSSMSGLSALVAALQSKEEGEYLSEAVNCAQHGFFRAAAVLSWCAAIDRIHRKIAQAGFPRFNGASTNMASQSSGRFKKFNKRQNVQSVSELREVPDATVLWIVEGLGWIDINQHKRLRSCFDLRCQCAHPGDAPVSEYNLLSHFSDLDLIVFKNKTFQL